MQACRRELGGVAWRGVREGEAPAVGKVEQVIVGDHGLALSSDLDSGPERCSEAACSVKWVIVSL